MSTVKQSGLNQGLLSMGHVDTFDQLFRAYFAPLCHFAGRFIEGGSDAEDLVEDLFLRLWQGQQSFENTTHAQAYLYSATRNACINFLKHGKLFAGKQNAHFNELEMTDEDSLKGMIRSEVWAEIYRAINNLPLQCAKVITLSFIDGKSNDEIAMELNLSKQTVKNHKVRGLRILKDTLPGDLFLLLIFIHQNFF